jgi:hypothetical protein
MPAVRRSETVVVHKRQWACNDQENDYAKYNG